MEAAKKPLDEIKSFFGGNPFSTAVGHKIEQATDANLSSEDWALNIEICDLVNLSDDGAKDAARAIRKRLQQNAGKNYTVIMYTLTVLETCVKNCGKRFHIQVCHKDFVQDLVKLIGPKNDPPTVVQEKILGLIQSWADTFDGQPDLAGVVQIYHDLKSKGIEFPMTDLDSMAPILTPKRSVESEPILHQVDLGERQVKVSGDQVVKIRRDLDVVQGNMAVFAEMLGEMKPGQENPDDFELIQELYTTCKEMQRRIADLLCSISSDELTAELLHVNDELNNLFLRYGRFRKNLEKTTGSQPNQPQSTASNEHEQSLIDFGNESQNINSGGGANSQNLTNKLCGLNVKNGGGNTVGGGGGGGAIPKTSPQQPKKKEDESDFDMFAQSRNVSYEKSKMSGSTYADNSNVDQSKSLGGAVLNKDPEEDIIKGHRQSDFDEMEEWLKANPAAAGGVGAPPEPSLTSSEFDRFLAERAAASAEGRATSGKVDKEKTESSMFAL